MRSDIPSHNLVVKDSFVSATNLEDCIVNGLRIDNRIIIDCMFESCTFENITWSNCFLQGTKVMNCTFANVLWQNWRKVDEVVIGQDLERTTTLLESPPSELADPTWLENAINGEIPGAPSQKTANSPPQVIAQSPPKTYSTPPDLVIIDRPQGLRGLEPLPSQLTYNLWNHHGGKNRQWQTTYLPSSSDSPTYITTIDRTTCIQAGECKTKPCLACTIARSFSIAVPKALSAG